MTTKVRKQKQVREIAATYLVGQAPTTYRTTMTSKGQVVIPAALRKKFGLTPQTQLAISEEEGKIVLQPITYETLEKLRGKYKGLGVSRALLEGRAEEREREDAKFNRPR